MSRQRKAKKKCSKCDKMLLITKNFNKLKSSSDGYAYQCKTCARSYDNSDVKKPVLHTNVNWDLVMAAKIPSRT